jgi:hypothetical protein
MKLLWVYYFFFFSFLMADKMEGQSLNGQSSFSVKNHATLNFSYNNINDLLVTKTIPAAIEIEVPPTIDKNDIYARISFAKSGNHQSIGLRYNLDKAIDVGMGSPDEVVLGDVPLKVLSLSKTNTGAMASTYYFDVIIHGATTFIEPDNYRFTINFSNTP